MRNESKPTGLVLAAYQVLLRTPALTCSELAAQLSLPTAEAAGLLARLEAHGQAKRLPGTTQRFQAASPGLAIAPTVQHLERAAADLRGLVAELADGYHRAAGGNDQNLPVRVVPSPPGPGDISQMWRDAKAEVRSIVKTPRTRMLVNTGARQTRLPERGVRFRLLHDRNVTPNLDHAGDSVLPDGFAHLRSGSNLPAELIVVDDRMALVSTGDHLLSPHSAPVLVSRSGLLDALIVLFERLWAVAPPAGTGQQRPTGTTNGAKANGSAGPSAHDLELLSLLLAGLPDKAVGRRLGLSQRTVQRRIQTLIKLVGVQTRMQLIWQATRNGWI